jgi:hypothetical protein
MRSYARLYRSNSRVDLTEITKGSVCYRKSDEAANYYMYFAYVGVVMKATIID